jgi:flagellar biosynthesis protein FlhF
LPAKTLRRQRSKYFKLLEQGFLQLRDSRAKGEVALSQKMLVAAQACITVFLLQQAPAAWAEAARRVLAQLTGRSVRPDRPVPGAALFEGLEKLCVLLDALETDGPAPAVQPDLASMRK